MSDAGAVSTAAGKGRRMAGLVMVLIALGGGVAGVALDRRVFLPWHFQGRPFGPGRGGPPGRDMEQHIRDHFAKELGLTAEQKQKVDSLMEQQMAEFRAVRSEMQPRIDTIFSVTRRAIDSILTPDQRTKAEELMRRRGPRGRGGPGGMGDRGPGGPDGPPPGHPGADGPPR